MLNQVKKFVQSMIDSDESFGSYYLDYMKDVQDRNIDREVKSQIKFGILQLSHLDHQIDFDYRKMVNDLNAKST